ncbi:MAG: hypothetical protein AAGA99_00455 [Actinomycetota bacterium]
MPEFQKKPVVIEARQITDSTVAVRLAEWVPNAYVQYVQGPMGLPDQYRLMIPTLEGVMEAGTGDWIIKGVQGEFYPCKPDIFEQTYEPLEAK